MPSLPLLACLSALLSIASLLFLLSLLSPSSAMYHLTTLLYFLSLLLPLLSLLLPPPKPLLPSLPALLPPPLRLILSTALAFHLLFMLRLFFPPSYLPPSLTLRPTHLDFGPKDYLNTADASLLPDPLERNAAFSLSPNSLGHFLWGLCLLPPLLAAHGRVVEPPPSALAGHHARLRLTSLLCASSLLVLFYPLYNTLKRLVKHSSTFATSSFCNNGLEWNTGCLVAICVPLLSLASRDLLSRFRPPPSTPSPPPPAAARRNSFQVQQASASSLLTSSSLPPRLSSFSPRAYSRMRAAASCCALALSASLLASAALYTATWGEYGAGDAAVLALMWGCWAGTVGRASLQSWKT
ncbi:hypothetical protein TeGR_g2208 [Tetraparma gracilis]|uniref:Uncharacterized protein n=1 Tax=Tetraparma gracilis TaxID=2962635 RepID=A0ABQ6NDQ4_9STRA|nr:hypothetical protein TeGR_g2208 [Tetraparma gracilis]